LSVKLIQSIRNLFNPDQFQGYGKKKRYFEGWYFKVVSKDEAAAFAVIPGVAMDETGRNGGLEVVGRIEEIVM
jgi:hypothetical protein